MRLGPKQKREIMSFARTINDTRSPIGPFWRYPYSAPDPCERMVRDLEAKGLARVIQKPGRPEYWFVLTVAAIRAVWPDNEESYYADWDRLLLSRHVPDFGFTATVYDERRRAHGKGSGPTPQAAFEAAMADAKTDRERMNQIVAPTPKPPTPA